MTNYEKVCKLLFDGRISRRQDITPYNMNTPITFILHKNNTHTETKEFLIDRDFFGLPGENSRELALGLLLQGYDQYTYSE